MSEQAPNPEQLNNPESSRSQNEQQSKLTQELIAIRDAADAERAATAQSSNAAVEKAPATPSQPDQTAEQNQQLERDAERARLREAFAQVNAGMDELKRVFAVDAKTTEQLQGQFLFLSRQVEASMQPGSQADIRAMDTANELRNQVRHLADNVEAEDARARLELNQLQEQTAQDLAAIEQTPDPHIKAQLSANLVSRAEAGLANFAASRSKITEMFGQFSTSIDRSLDSVRTASSSNIEVASQGTSSNFEQGLAQLSGSLSAQGSELRRTSESSLHHGRSSFEQAHQNLTIR